VETAKTKGIRELETRTLESKAKMAKADEGKIDPGVRSVLIHG
jgi:hypothetical protein